MLKTLTNFFSSGPGLIVFALWTGVWIYQLYAGGNKAGLWWIGAGLVLGVLFF
jgi:hypothetical protein